MARDASLARSPVFEGLDDAALDAVAEHMRPRQFAPDEQLCQAGDPSDRIWLITGASSGFGRALARRESPPNATWPRGRSIG